MRKLVKICSLVLIVVMALGLNFTFVYGSDTNNKVTLTFDYNESAEANGNVEISLKIQSEDGVDTSQIIAIKGTLDYDTSIFENPTINGENNFSGTMNSSNGQFTLDSQSFTNGQTIGIITLKVKNVSSNSDTTLNVKDLQIGLQDNTLVEVSTLSIGNVTVTGIGTESEKNKNEETSQNAGGSSSTAEESQNAAEESADEKSGSSSASDKTSSTQSNSTDNNTTAVEKSNYIQPISTDSTTSKNVLPKTGWKVYAFLIVIGLALIDIIGYLVYRNKYL